MTVLLTAYMSTLTYWSFLFICFFYVFFGCGTNRLIRFDCQYPMNLNSLVHCICVPQGNISAAAGLEPGTPGL